MSDTSDKRYCYKATLKSMYGLTDSLIRALGEPDKRVPNPHYVSGPPASLYLIERVEQWIDIHHDEVEAASRKRAARSAQASEIAERQRRALVEWASTIEIKIDLPSEHRLRREAMEQYKEWHESMPRDAGYYNGLIAIARHRYTNYEDLLHELTGKVGCAEAYSIIRARANSAIADRLR